MYIIHFGLIIITSYIDYNLKSMEATPRLRYTPNVQKQTLQINPVKAKVRKQNQTACVIVIVLVIALLLIGGVGFGIYAMQSRSDNNSGKNSETHKGKLLHERERKIQERFNEISKKLSESGIDWDCIKNTGYEFPENTDKGYALFVMGSPNSEMTSVYVDMIKIQQHLQPWWHYRNVKSHKWKNHFQIGSLLWKECVKDTDKTNFFEFVSTLTGGNIANDVLIYPLCDETTEKVNGKDEACVNKVIKLVETVKNQGYQIRLFYVVEAWKAGDPDVDLKFQIIQRNPELPWQYIVEPIVRKDIISNIMCARKAQEGTLDYKSDAGYDLSRDNHPVIIIECQSLIDRSYDSTKYKTFGEKKGTCEWRISMYGFDATFKYFRGWVSNSHIFRIDLPMRLETTTLKKNI